MTAFLSSSTSAAVSWSQNYHPSISKQSVLLAHDTIRMQNRVTVKQNIFQGEGCFAQAWGGENGIIFCLSVFL
jgi:hypothetical protein